MRIHIEFRDSVVDYETKVDAFRMEGRYERTLILMFNDSLGNLQRETYIPMARVKTFIVEYSK